MLPTVIVDGIDLCDRYDLIWTNEGTLSPPQVRTNRLEIPARDGALDLTEVLTGDAVFGDREQTFVFFVREGMDFETAKTQLLNLLHGRELDYELSIDPGYTYHGRWLCDSHALALHNRKITFDVLADPWKRGEHRTYRVQCAGGTDLKVTNARRHVSPTFTVPQKTLVEYKGRAWVIPEAGEWTLDLFLDEGVSSIHINGAPTMCNTTWADLAAKYPHWSDIPKGTRWSDLFMLMGPPDPDEQVVAQVDFDTYDL